MKTLQKRLRVLDPLDTNTRQRKETFDCVAWVREIVQSHEDQFARHNITAQFKTEPPSGSLRITAVKGMIVQILENLISNSVYWLQQERKRKPTFKPELTITVRSATRQIICSDNGPGVARDRCEEIFQPFITTKPPGEGKGLGLFISREIASYHGATLDISQDSGPYPDRLNTFILNLGEA